MNVRLPFLFFPPPPPPPPPPLFFRSLRARLTTAAAGTILAAVVLFAVATVLIVHHELRASLTTALRQRAQEVAQLAVSAPAVLNSPGALESPVSGRQIAVEVLNARGRLLARSESLGAELLPTGGVTSTALRHARAGSETATIGGRPFAIYAAPIADAGGPAAVGWWWSRPTRPTSRTRPGGSACWWRSSA